MNRTARNLVYSLGNFANTLCQQVVGGQIRYFYVRRLGLEPGWYGALYAIFGLWNAVNDPLLGQLSDRTRTRWGRRVPYLIFGALPLGVAFFLLWTPPDPQTFGPLLTGLYLLAMLSLYDSIFTLMTVAYNSLFPELADDLKARSSLSSLREILAVIALLLAFILAPILRESVGFIAMGLIIGAITTLGYGASGFAVKERPIPASEPGVPLLTSLKETLSSVPFRWYLGANMMKEYVFLALPGTLPFWREFALKITGRGAGDQEAIMLGSAFVLTIPLLLVWQRITPRLGAKRAWIISNFLFLPGLAMMFLANDFTTGLIACLLIAPGLAGFQMMPIVLLTSVIDEDKRRTGERREGMFFGINGGMVKLSFTIQAIFDAFIFVATGFRAGSDIQTETAVLGIRIAMGIAPIVACLVGAFCLSRIRLDERAAPQTAAVAAD